MPLPRLTAKSRTIGLGSSPSRAWSAWRERGKRPAQILLLVAGATSFLSATATVHAIYTLQVPYILAAIGILVGAPWVISGWRNAGSWLRWSSVALPSVYLISLVVGHPGFVPGSPHTGRPREFVYLVDLCVGLGTAGVIAGVWGGLDRSRAMSSALAIGGALAGLYAVYQWVGLHFHGPFTHVNNTLNSNGVTSGARQGDGLLGWERTQGTFLEPHFLGAYVASLWPLCAWAALSTSRRSVKRGLWAAGTIMLAALLTADSAPAVASLIAVCVAAVGVLAMARGKPTIAAVVVSSVVGALALVPITGLQQGAAATTGRTVGAINLTTQFRTATWSRALDLWAQQPILGTGPGQASVRLTVAGVDQSSFHKLAPGVLLSAQGLWAATLLDAGLFGLTAWLLFLGGVIGAATRNMFSRPSYYTAALLAAVVIAVLGNLTAGDRLELWVWLLLGVALAAASDRPRTTANRSRQ